MNGGQTGRTIFLLVALTCVSNRCGAQPPEASPSDLPVAPAAISDDTFAGPQFWIESQFLYWWLKGNRVPALLTTSPQGTLRDDAGELPGASVVFGGERLDDNGRPGAGFIAGWWLDDEQWDAVTLNWMSLGDGANTGNFTQFSTGDPILARPFFNLDTDQENAELVAFSGVLDGRFTSITESELHSLAADYRRNLRRGPLGRVDLLIGYRYLRFRESLQLMENLVSTAAGGLVQQGTTIDVLDEFDTENDFHGGELGGAAEFYRGPFTFATAAKLAVGNLHQQVRIQGTTSVTSPGDPTTISPGGLLALPTNIGDYRDDELSLLPQLDVRLQLALTRTLDVTCGYSLLYVTNVLRTGNQIDRSIDPSQLPGTPGGVVEEPRPGVLFDDTTLWAQGVTLGITYVH